MGRLMGRSMNGRCEQHGIGGQGCRNNANTEARRERERERDESDLPVVN
jgi:hypothetical protein